MSPIRKKIVDCIFLLGSIFFLIVVYNGFSQYKIQKLIDSDNLVDSMLFYCSDNNAISLKEMEENTYYVYLPSHGDLTNLRVKIENIRVDFMNETETISVYNNRKNICSFEPDMEYAVVFYDNKDDVITEINVVFMKSANLPTIYLTTESGSFDKLDEDKTYSEGALFSFITPEGITQYSNVMAEISARGNHTLDFEKKSYQFDLNQECDLLDMGESSTWILLSNSFDLTNLRNKITYDMAVEAGMEGSPKSEFVDVYFNRVYHGTYLLTEKVEFGRNRLDYEDLESKNEMLNGTKRSGFETFSIDDGLQKGYLLPQTPEDISGGYLLEHDYGHKFDSESSGFKTTNNECYVIKNPKYASTAEVEYISNLFQEIEDAIKSEDGYNPKTGKHYSEYIDMKSWADKYIVEEFTKNHGGGCTSSYFYKLPDEISKKVFGGPVWDYDKAYGRNGGTAAITNDLNYLTLHSDYTNWFYYLYQQEDFREMVREEYRTVFVPYIENNLLQQIDFYAQWLQPSLGLNFHRFKNMYADEVEVDTSTYFEEVEMLKRFIEERKATLDEMWIENVEVCTIRFEGSKEKNRCVTVKKGDQLQQLLSVWEENNDDYIWIDSETGERIMAGIVVDRDIVANAVIP